MNIGQPVILLADDDDNDIFFIRRELDKANVKISLQIVHNGQEVIDYLGGIGRFGDRARFPLPSLMLLDLKMPLANGFDVLEWLRSQAALSSLPVVVLTSSPEERDREQTAALGVKLYFVKPPTGEMIAEMMRLLGPSNSVAT